MLLKIFKNVFAPLFSLFVFVLGSGLFTTLIVLRLHQEHVSSLMIGAMAAVFYAGLIIGSFRIERIIVNVGHIRAFSGFASALAVIYILQGVYISTWFWLILRFAGGFATAGIFVVIESWLLSLGKVKTRGTILSFYMISYYAAQSVGQLLLNIGDLKGLLLFALASMLSSLSVIPLAMTRIPQPQISEPSALKFKRLYQVSGSGIIGSFSSGMIMGVIYGLLPLFLASKKLPTSEVTSLMSITIIGGMLLQYPLGRLSDVIDRRKILIFVALMTITVSLLTIFIFSRIWVTTAALFLLGGFTFTLYPISISHACDHLDASDIVSGTQGLLFAYSIGAAIGPIIAPGFIEYFGPDGFFIYLSSVSFLLAIFLFWRSTHVLPPEEEEQEQFVSMPQTTPVTAELDPRGEES